MNLVNKTNDGHNVYGYTVWKFWCELTIDEHNPYVWNTLWKCWHELTIDEWVHCLCVYMFVWNFNNGCEWYNKRGALPFQDDLLF